MGGADTIVVGAGSAGAVIAARMTESPANQVLLLEAGPDYKDISQLPRDLADGTRNSQRSHDWGYAHRPSPASLSLPLPRGRVVGGSSAVNTCIALRGMPEDYDEWAQRGLADWSWEQCLPAFKRLERDLDFQNAWHGTDGPVPIRRHRREELTPWQAAFLDACASMGLPRCADSNDPTTTGYGPHAMNKVDGVRQSAARCYLTPEVRARPNLTLSPLTLVHRVVFEDRRAVGVEVERAGKREVLRARRVVLCGGAIATPGLLLRSGVGPRGEVARLRASLVAEVPAVGARLLDHPGAACFFRWRGKLPSTSSALVQNVLRFTSRGSHVRNDMQVQPGSFLPLPWLNLPFFTTLSLCLGKPVRPGRLRFRSADPRARVDIENDFLVDAADLARAVEAVQVIVELAQQPALRKLGALVWPGAKVARDAKTLGAWLSSHNMSGFHPSGTVPMGAERSPDAATDGRGRVRGVEGLIVADASLMPTIPSANTNLATLMIGERFGAWLRDGAL